MKRLCTLVLTFALLLVLSVPVSAAGFTDIPSTGTLAAEVQKAVDAGLMNGYSTSKFGYFDSMTRAQFVTVLVRMFGWTMVNVTQSSFTDTASQGLYAYIETAAAHGVMDRGGTFRPSAPITREEMSVMLVRALGYKGAAESAAKDALPFTDVSTDQGYIGIAYAIGMTKGVTATTFAPRNTATRAQAAAMLVRIHDKLTSDLDFVHAFYAISSYSQLGLTDDMDAVSAGWSRMTWDGSSAVLSTTSANGNEFSIPSGYAQVCTYLKNAGKPLNLSVYMDVSGGLRDLMASASGRSQAVAEIVNELTISYSALGENPYAGVTIDFEGLRAAQKANFNAFLTDLAAQVHALKKTLYVTVQPVMTTGTYYDGYDYRTIGNLADRVILMAHDYDPTSLSGYIGSTYYKTAAPAPISQVYEALRAITDADTGVADPDKIVLAVSWKAVAWKTDTSGKLLSETPVYPTLSTVYSRLKQSGTTLGWSDTYQMPYAVYTTESGEQYFLWYEDSRSVAAKVQMAKLFGIHGLSLWRLGMIPAYTDAGLNFNLLDGLQ